MRRLLALGSLLLLLGCPADNQAPADDATGLVPGDGEVAGWNRSGTLDTAVTTAELTALLGAGGAQPFIDSGFVKFCRQNFAGQVSGSNRRLELRVADMADSAGARGIYAALAAGQTPWTGDNPGREARISRDSAAVEVEFWTGRFYVRLALDTGSTPALEACRYFSLKVARKADSTAPEPPRPKDVVELVPVDNEMSGWTRSAALRLAENATQLYELIDGEAQPYIDNGFVKAALQSYTGTLGSNTVQLDLRIFDQGDSTNAKAVYPLVATGTEVPWTDPDRAGVEARIDELLFSYRIDFRDAKFYVSVNIQERSPAALEVAKLFCRNVSSAIRD